MRTRLSGALAAALLAAVAVAVPGRARATTANDLCAANANPCRVTMTVNVTPGSVIDVGSRRLVISGQGILNLTSGAMTLRASDLTVDASASLRARGSPSNPGGQISVIAGTITLNGTVDASGSPGGAVLLTSTGPITLNNMLNVRSLNDEQDGGRAEFAGTDVIFTASSSITALGGRLSTGGSIEVDASGALNIAGDLTASGGDGGDIDLSGGGNVTVSSSTEMDADASVGGGFGGGISIDCPGNLVMDGDLSTTGNNGTEDTGGGDGGDISLEGSTISVTRTAARIAADGGSPDGFAGDIDVSSDDGGIDFRGILQAKGNGPDGSGGTLSLDAATNASVSGEIDATGGGDTGGDIDVSAAADLTITQTASLIAGATAAGIGGNIDVSADGTALIRGALTSDGGSAQGGGGTIRATACTVRIDSSGTLSSLRPNGINTLIGRDITIVQGTLRADPGSGRNIIRFAGEDYSPAILPGAQVNPAASLVEDATVIPCNPLTPTPSKTPTPTRTPRPGTPTATGQPGVCVGDCDDSGDVSVSDLIVGVNIALGNQPVGNCPSFDPDKSGTVDINELIKGVNNTLNGCAA